MHQLLESCKAFFLNSENTGKIKAHDSFVLDTNRC